MNEGVPTYEITPFGFPSSCYAVFVFVLNEGERIRRQIEKMKCYANTIDIYIVDGGSEDGSLDHKWISDCGVRGLLVKIGPGKLSAQMRIAISWAMGNGYKGIICMDGNDKDDPSALPLFVEKLAIGYDHVQGSRFVVGGRAVNTPIMRYWGVRAIHAPIISLAAGFHYTDTTNGFRAYSMNFLRDPEVAPFRDVFQSYELHYYLAIRAVRLGYHVCEIPVARIYPVGSFVPTKINGLMANLQIFKTLVNVCMGKFDPS